MQELSIEQCESVSGGLSITNTAGVVIGGATLAFGIATANPVLILMGSVEVAMSVSLD